MRDKIAQEKGLGRRESVQSRTASKALLALLAQSDVPNASEVEEHLRVLVAENKACCQGKKPKELHLYTGFRPGREHKDLDEVAQKAASAWESAVVLGYEIQDPECSQMLTWIADALVDYQSGYAAAADTPKKMDRNIKASTTVSKLVDLDTST